MNEDKEQLYAAGVALAKFFCERNQLPMPAVVRLQPGSGLYRLIGTCAFYRPKMGINIAVEKCANRGYGGRAWSWPAYTVDRTPYGVIQHELGHHVDLFLSQATLLFSYRIYTSEEPLTGYLGTDKKPTTFYMEWFAELFRLFVTNPDLCRLLRPKFYAVMLKEGFKPAVEKNWEDVLVESGAPKRITDQANKKVTCAST